MARLAEPLMTVLTTELIKKLNELIKVHSIDTIVVGLPRNLAGDDTQQTGWVRDWVQHAKGKVDATFYWQDEALTSRLAQARQLSHKRPQDIDSLAAAIILQDFLDSDETQRQVC